MINPTIADNVIGARGINPIGKNGTAYMLIDRLDGQGIQIYEWDEAVLGMLPTEEELTRGANPLIALSSQDTELGFIATATLTGGTSQTVFWRCITPSNEEFTASGAAVAGVESWEVEAPTGTYIMQVWADGFGFAQMGVENA